MASQGCISWFIGLEASGVWIPFSTSSGGVLWRGVGSQASWLLCRPISVPVALLVSVSQEQAASCVTSCQLCDEAGCSSAAVSTLCHHVAAGAAPGTDTEPWAPGSIPWHSIPWQLKASSTLGENGEDLGPKKLLQNSVCVFRDQ